MFNTRTISEEQILYAAEFWLEKVSTPPHYANISMKSRFQQHVKLWPDDEKSKFIKKFRETCKDKLLTSTIMWHEISKILATIKNNSEFKNKWYFDPDICATIQMKIEPNGLVFLNHACIFADSMFKKQFGDVVGMVSLLIDQSLKLLKKDPELTCKFISIRNLSVKKQYLLFRLLSNVDLDTYTTISTLLKKLEGLSDELADKISSIEYLSLENLDTITKLNEHMIKALNEFQHKGLQIEHLQGFKDFAYDHVECLRYFIDVHNYNIADAITMLKKLEQHHVEFILYVDAMNCFVLHHGDNNQEFLLDLDEVVKFKNLTQLYTYYEFKQHGLTAEHFQDKDWFDGKKYQEIFCHLMQKKDNNVVEAMYIISSLKDKIDNFNGGIHTFISKFLPEPQTMSPTIWKGSRLQQPTQEQDGVKFPQYRTML